MLNYVTEVILRLLGWRPIFPDYSTESLAAKATAAVIVKINTPPTVSYDPYTSFREGVIAFNGPLAWITRDAVRRAVALAQEETGVFPASANEGAQALIRYVVIGGKLARGAALTEEERRIADRIETPLDHP